MIQEITQAFILIFIAEMGDKTQILALAFATRYPVKKVLLGIGIGSFLNHGLAVLLGSLLSNIIPVDAIQMVAGAAFIFFALWTLKSENDGEDEEEISMKFGPIPTVALAFFIGELGDKTQLTAITLAADAHYPYLILLGTVAGMIATGGLGIIVGKKMGDNIPEIGIKLFAAIVFLFFGLQKLYQTLPANYLSSLYLIPFTLVLIAIISWMVFHLFRARALGIQSEFLANSKRIHDYNTHIDANLKSLHKTLQLTEKEAIEKLADTLYMMNTVQNPDALKDAVTLIRELEFILLGRYLKSSHHLNTYFEELSALKPSVGLRTAKAYRLRQPLEERVLNLGNEETNLFMIEIKDGYMLIDTGHPHQYRDFLKALNEAQISLNEITFIFLTHAHHVGFLATLLDQTEAQVILHPLAAERMKFGKDHSYNYYSSTSSKLYYKWLSILGKGPKDHPPIYSPERYLLVTNQTRPNLESMLEAQIVSLPGHSNDSIGIILSGSAFFCGDALMNRSSNRNLLTMRIEDRKDYKATWHKMLDLDYKKIYPSHGKVFSKSQFLKFKDKLVQNKLFS